MKRKLAGAVVMVVVALLLGEALPLPGSMKWWLQPALAAVLGAAAGGFIAREGFVAVALATQVMIWVLMVYLLGAIANWQTTYSEIAAGNLGVLAISGFAAMLGALLGQRLARRATTPPVIAGA